MNKPRTRNGTSVAGPAPLETTEKLASKKRSLTGFTIMEIMVALIIVAIVTALAMPMYNKTVDEMHKKEAKTVLGIIRSAELMYKIDNKTNQYVSATFGSNLSGDTSRSTLNVDAHNNLDWEYEVTGVSGMGITAAATAAAKRLRGPHTNKYVNVTVSNGTIEEYPW